MPIRLLPPPVAAAIAAGEVIERPASVVKELVENSVDAGAKAITVEVRAGGLEAIRVTDDGTGIPPQELALAFERHATSKIETIEDLDRIATLGFRGEALASIAAAARVRLQSRPAGAGAASFVELADGRVVRTGTQAGPPGTTVIVEALFAQVPARLKFLRGIVAETGRVRQVVDHLAMAFPHVRFSLRAGDRTLLQTPGNGHLRDALVAVHGAEVAGALLDLAPSDRAPYRVHGLISPPALSRANRSGISMFVNGRWVQHRALTAALEEAYTGLLMEGRYPIAAVFLEVPPSEVDVNVHPSKREVRFLREGDAFSSVQRAAREALVTAMPVLEARGLLAHPASPPRTAPGQESAAHPGAPAPSSTGGPHRASPAFDFAMASQSGAWTPLPLPQRDMPVPVPVHTAPVPPVPVAAGTGPQLPPLRVLGQIANTYIVADGPDGMYLIDQHAAHESVLFYRLLRQWDARAPEVQPLLEPAAVSLTADQADEMDRALPALAGYGLHAEPFGGRTWLVRAVPAVAHRVAVPVLLAALLEGARSASGTASPPAARTPAHWAIAASIACHSAVRAGQTLTPPEMEALVMALAAGYDPNHCPHGRPTTVRVTTAALEREFGRA